MRAEKWVIFLDFNIYEKDFCQLIEESNYRMLKSVFLTEIDHYEYGTIVYSNKIDYQWYNHAYVNQNEIKSISSIDDFMLICDMYFKKKKRKCCIYLPEELDILKISSEDWKYCVFEKENWWYFDTFAFVESNSVDDFLISKINNNNFDDFAKIFDSCFVLKDNLLHIKCLKNAFIGQGLATHIGLIAYKNFTPVGTLCMIINENFCGIYAVATMPEYRNQGVFTYLFEHAVRICRMRGIRHILLQTVSKDECNEVYKKRGFINIFSRIGYLIDNFA